MNIAAYQKKKLRGIKARVLTTTDLDTVRRCLADLCDIIDGLNVEPESEDYDEDEQ